jgi:hypothetical protein
LHKRRPVLSSNGAGFLFYKRVAAIFGARIFRHHEDPSRCLGEVGHGDYGV